MFLAIMGAAGLAAWTYLLQGRGAFWRESVDRSDTPPPSPAPNVVAIVPARNEETVVARAVSSLAKQQYPGEFHIVLVDDASSDCTADAARAAAPETDLTVIRGAPLEPGWTGKLWALSQGIQSAIRRSPHYLLFTDADIVHPPGTLSSLVGRAEAAGYDLASLMVRLECETLAERALIPAFVFFFFMLYPPAWIRDPRRRTAGAAGGCILIRSERLERIGGIAAIRGELIDDCALAAAVKASGGRVWLGLSDDVRSIRPYQGWGEIGRMISRTAFTQLGHSSFLLAGTVVGLAITYLGPPLLALRTRGWTARMGGAAWVLMSVAYTPTLRYYRRSPLWAPLLPLVAAFYLGATVHSALSYWRGRGGLWKGRVQDGLS